MRRGTRKAVGVVRFAAVGSRKNSVVVQSKRDADTKRVEKSVCTKNRTPIATNGLNASWAGCREPRNYRRVNKVGSCRLGRSCRRVASGPSRPRVLGEGEVGRLLGAREGVVAANRDPVKHASAHSSQDPGMPLSSTPSPFVSRMAHTPLGIGRPPFGSSWDCQPPSRGGLGNGEASEGARERATVRVLLLRREGGKVFSSKERRFGVPAFRDIMRLGCPGVLSRNGDTIIKRSRGGTKGTGEEGREGGMEWGEASVWREGGERKRGDERTAS